MGYILKVSPKGQVTFPKKLREALEVRDRIEVEIKDGKAIVGKPESVTNDLAGCFKKYTLKKKFAANKDVEKAVEITAHEIAKKDN
ncbi:MAG: AbrB/MazE/SpoVT family DNA-binding domain-containing protein [Candidatus Brocadia sp.]|nr:MAG: AbrB/MazE/SpoVT family DNA-binding domain-containing protein [Candidatus Brocadia sp.]